MGKPKREPEPHPTSKKSQPQPRSKPAHTCTCAGCRGVHGVIDHCGIAAFGCYP